MGAIEDTRRVLQHFLAPELRAISVRLDAVEKRLDGVDRKLERVDQRFEDLEQRAQKRHDEVMSGLRQLFDLNSIQERLTRLESRHAVHQ